MKEAMALVLSIAFLSVWSSSLGADEIAVIVNAQGPLVSISEADIRDIYLGKKRFVGGIKLIPIHTKQEDKKERFLTALVGKTPREYTLYWLRLVFAEGLALPPLRDSDLEVVTLVQYQKGAIGYVSLDQVTGNGVVILKILRGDW